MAALYNRAGHYIFALWFLLLVDCLVTFLGHSVSLRCGQKTVRSTDFAYFYSPGGDTNALSKGH